MTSRKEVEEEENLLEGEFKDNAAREGPAGEPTTLDLVDFVRVGDDGIIGFETEIDLENVGQQQTEGKRGTYSIFMLTTFHFWYHFCAACAVSCTQALARSWPVETCGFAKDAGRAKKKRK